MAPIFNLLMRTNSCRKIIGIYFAVMEHVMNIKRIFKPLLIAQCVKDYVL